MMMRRGFRRGPGLVRTAARTAVVAGTATAVVGGVQKHQANKAAAEAQAQAPPQQVQELPQQIAAQQAAQQVPAAAPAGDDMVAKLQELAQLHDSGVLSDEEFASAKAKLLG
jgi:hypothetical protein